MKLRYIGLASTGCTYGKVYECEVHYTPSGFMQVFPQWSSNPMQFSTEAMFLKYWEPISLKEEKRMLEFENVNVAPQPVNELREAGPVNVAGPGYVLVPIETYNDLLIKANAASGAIKLERRKYGLHDTIEVTVDNCWLYEQANALIYRWFPPEVLKDFDIVTSADQLFVISATVARAKEPTVTTNVHVESESNDAK